MRSLRTRQGSITVESAIVLPAFIFFILTIAYVMSFVRLQGLVQSAITQVAMDSAKNAYGEELLNQGLYAGAESIISTVNGTNAIKGRLGSRFLEHAGIQGGASGLICLTDSISNNNQVIVRANYSYTPSFNIFGLRNIMVSHKAISRKWTGYCPGNDGISDEIVYIARTGSVYHKTPNCTHINLDIKMVDGSSLDELRNNEGGKYSCCERCSKNQPKVGSFYITTYGDAYHKSGDCSGLKRDISAVAISQVGDKGPCSRCYGQN